MSGPKTLECFAGLSDSAVPVRVGENLIGYRDRLRDSERSAHKAAAFVDAA